MNVTRFANLSLRNQGSCVYQDFYFWWLKRWVLEDKWITWIKKCISSVGFSALVIGALVDLFQSSRGVKQEDPLLPYLFCNCYECASYLLKWANLRGYLQGWGVSSRDGRVDISCVLFIEMRRFVKPGQLTQLCLRLF